MTERYITIETNAALRDLEAALWKRFYAQEIIAQGLPYGCPLDVCPGDVREFLSLAPEYVGREYQLVTEHQPRVWARFRCPLRVLFPLDGGQGATLIVDDAEIFEGSALGSAIAWLDTVHNVPLTLPTPADLDTSGFPPTQQLFERHMRVLGLRQGVRADARAHVPDLTRRARAQVAPRWEAALAERERPF